MLTRARPAPALCALGLNGRVQAAGQCDGVNRVQSLHLRVTDCVPSVVLFVVMRPPAVKPLAMTTIFHPGAFSPTYACLAVTTDCDERTQCNGESTLVLPV